MQHDVYTYIYIYIEYYIKQLRAISKTLSSNRIYTISRIFYHNCGHHQWQDVNKGTL